MKKEIIILILLILPILNAADIGIEEGIIISPNITFTPTELDLSKIKFPETPLDIEKSLESEKIFVELQKYFSGKGEFVDAYTSEVVELGESDYTSLNQIIENLESKRKKYYKKEEETQIKITVQEETAFLEVEEDVKILVDFIEEENGTKPRVNIFINPEYSNFRTEEQELPEASILEERSIVNVINIIIIVNIILFSTIFLISNRKRIQKFFMRRF